MPPIHQFIQTPTEIVNSEVIDSESVIDNGNGKLIKTQEITRKITKAVTVDIVAQQDKANKLRAEADKIEQDVQADQAKAVPVVSASDRLSSN